MLMLFMAVHKKYLYISTLFVMYVCAYKTYLEYRVSNVNLFLLSFIRNTIMFLEVVSYFMSSMCKCEL